MRSSAEYELTKDTKTTPYNQNGVVINILYYTLCVYGLNNKKKNCLHQTDNITRAFN